MNHMPYIRSFFHDTLNAYNKMWEPILIKGDYIFMQDNKNF